MGYTKDLWTKPSRNPDGSIKYNEKNKVVRERNARWGKGKRWLACWQDPEGNEPSRAFTNLDAANRYWKAQETDVERGEYIDPKAGQERIDDLAQRWLNSRDVDPKSLETYRRAYRLHIKPTFGKRTVKGIKVSQVQELLVSTSPGNRQTVRLVLHGVFELAVADELIRRNPVRSDSIATSSRPAKRIVVWSDKQVGKLIDAHPPELKVAPIILAGCGLREGELYGLDASDLEHGEDPIVKVRRQVKYVDGAWVFAMPKRDKERDVPLPDWVAAALRVHPVKPLTVTLPWETPDGKPVTHRLLVSKDGEHLRSDRYKTAWGKALEAAGIAPSRQSGRHALRHYYATTQLAGGVLVPELATYLGHEDPGYTMRIYVHAQEDAHTRSRRAIDARMFRPRAV